MIEKLVRSEVKKIIPYDANQISCRIKMDANESPYEIPENIKNRLNEFITKNPSLNFYPDSDSIELRDIIADFWNVTRDNIVVGNGSDQMISIITSTFAGHDDCVICTSPSFSMYRISSLIAGAKPIEIQYDKDKDFTLNPDEIIDTANNFRSKLIFLCNPNNPTGNLIPENDIIKIIKNCQNSIIVIDEAYAEFSYKSFIPKLNDFKNVIVLRTYSKAYGIAGVRCGYSVSNSEITKYLNVVKPPFNLNTITQKIAKYVLEDIEQTKVRIDSLVKERELLQIEFEKLGIKYYKSEANYILCKFENSEFIFKELLKNGILVREFKGSKILSDCLRFSVGLKEQNQEVVEILKKIVK